MNGGVVMEGNSLALTFLQSDPHGSLGILSLERWASSSPPPFHRTLVLRLDFYHPPDFDCLPLLEHAWSELWKVQSQVLQVRHARP